MTIKLYCFGESGNSYKAALALQLTGLPWEPVYVDFFAGETRSKDFLRLNPKGEAPVMVDGDLVLSQSGAIQHHIADRTGMLGGSTAEEKREVLSWQFWDNHRMSSTCGVTRYLCNFVPEEKRPDAVISWLQRQLRNAWKTLDSALEGRDWLVGDSITIADISCCGYLYYPEPFGFDRTRWPAIDSWLTRIASQPGWKHPYDMMPGHPSDRGL